MRILFDSERMRFPDTGIYHYCLNLGLELKKQLDYNEGITYYLPEDAGAVYGAWINYILHNRLHKLLLPQVNDHDVWHCTYQSSNYLPLLNKKIRVVLTIHDLNFMYDETLSRSRKEKYLSKIQHNINRASVIICVSEYSRKDVELYCNLKNKEIMVIHNGTNQLSEPSLSKHSYKPSRPFLFSIGTLSPKKNFHRIFPLLKRNPLLELVIAGRNTDADYSRMIMSSAHKMGLQNSIHFTGNISENEKSWYYHNCKAFVFPSISEGFGLPVTEAMSVGKPMFLSDRTSLPEIGKDVAFYFREFSEEHMHATFNKGMKEYEEKNMKEEIKARSQAFSWEKAAKEYIRVYRSLA